MARPIKDHHSESMAWSIWYSFYGGFIIIFFLNKESNEDTFGHQRAQSDKIASEFNGYGWCEYFFFFFFLLCINLTHPNSLTQWVIEKHSRHNGGGNFMVINEHTMAVHWPSASCPLGGPTSYATSKCHDLYMSWLIQSFFFFFFPYHTLYGGNSTSARASFDTY